MKRNKSIQQVIKMEKYLKFFSGLLEIELKDWGVTEIMTAWVALETSKKRRLTTNGWLLKMKDMKLVFESLNLNQMVIFSREINFLTQQYIKERIDTDEEPHKKLSANQPPYWVWEKLVLATKTDPKHKKDHKRMNQLQLHVLLTWSLSTGARLAELMRLKVSDVSMIDSNGLKYLRLTIRRGKSSRDGRKPIYYKCLQDKVKPDLCPIKAFVNYGNLNLKSGKVFRSQGDYVFPMKPRPDTRFRKHQTARNITEGWKKVAEDLSVPEEFFPQGHSGHKCLLNAAYAMQCSKKEIMDIANWNSTKCMQDYVEAPNENMLNAKLCRMTITELDEKCKHARD